MKSVQTRDCEPDNRRTDAQHNREDEEIEVVGDAVSTLTSECICGLSGLLHQLAVQDKHRVRRVIATRG